MKNNKTSNSLIAVATLASVLLLLAACSNNANIEQAPAEASGAMSSTEPQSGDLIQARQQLHQQSQIAHAVITENWPASVIDRRTTDADIYIGNLNAQIDDLQKKLPARDWSPAHRQLAAMLYQRYQILGKLQDARQALALTASLSDQQPPVAADQLVRAQILLGFHRFGDVQAIIDGLQPAPNSAVKSQIAGLQQSLDSATGAGWNSGEGINLRAGDPVNSLVQRAGRLLDQGKLLQASLLLKQAQYSYQDVNPYPLAWLHVQQGIGFLRYEDLQAAEIFFAAAHERLPQYFLATEHLAEVRLSLGKNTEAVELYRQVTEQTGNPAFYAQLAVAEQQLGNTQAAAEASQCASEGYADLTREFPAMMADHAAGYYLEHGQQERALQLAQQNIKLRQSPSAWLLLAEAAHANSDQKLACSALSELDKLDVQPPESVLLRAQVGCSG